MGYKGCLFAAVSLFSSSHHFTLHHFTNTTTTTTQSQWLNPPRLLDSTTRSWAPLRRPSAAPSRPSLALPSPRRGPLPERSSTPRARPRSRLLRRRRMPRASATACRARSTRLSALPLATGPSRPRATSSTTRARPR